MKQILCLLIALFLIHQAEALGAASTRYRVQFRGQITQSRNNITGQTPFEDFEVDAPFHGSFLFDSSLINGSDTISGTAGTFRRYFSAFRDYKVEFDLPGRTYTYQPPLFGSGQFEDRSLTLWNVADDFTIQQNETGKRDELQLRVQNYPGQSAGGAFGVPIGFVTPDQYVNGWYPHAAFLVLTDYVEPLDGVMPATELVDVARLNANSGSRTFSIRFTDANESSWDGGSETIYASLFGDITELTVIIPEPTTATLALAAVCMFFKRRY